MKCCPGEAKKKKGGRHYHYFAWALTTPYRIPRTQVELQPTRSPHCSGLSFGSRKSAIPQPKPLTQAMIPIAISQHGFRLSPNFPIQLGVYLLKVTSPHLCSGALDFPNSWWDLVQFGRSSLYHHFIYLELCILAQDTRKNSLPRACSYVICASL